MHTEIQLDYPKESHHLINLEIDVRITVKLSFKNRISGVDWIM
jgi:hypothetical protein